MTEELLQIDNLYLCFFTERGVVRALNGVNLSLCRGQVLGLVGESGCGKSITARAILRLLPPSASIESGRILFDGTNLLTLPERQMRLFRGGDIAMIFQEPASSLNPVLTIGNQLLETLHWHSESGAKSELRDRMIEMLRVVGMPNPTRVASQYAHELSGGMQQRAMIAMALCSQPQLLIADEPTTALDVTIQAQIMDLLRALRGPVISSILFITHDFGLVAELCDRVVVMYAGTVVECGPTEEVFDHPRHPYTQGLFGALPQRHQRDLAFATIPGTVPSGTSLPEGCPFHPRCGQMMTGVCDRQVPTLHGSLAHGVACHLYTDGAQLPECGEGESR